MQRCVPHAFFLLAVKTSEPWLAVIEERIPVKCCCSPHRTQFSSHLSAIVRLHTNTHRHYTRQWGNNNGSAPHWPFITQLLFGTQLFCHNTSTETTQQLQHIVEWNEIFVVLNSSHTIFNMYLKSAFIQIHSLLRYEPSICSPLHSCTALPWRTSCRLNRLLQKQNEV